MLEMIKYKIYLNKPRMKMTKFKIIQFLSWATLSSMTMKMWLT